MTYDYLIVGAGSAGAILAARLMLRKDTIEVYAHAPKR